MIQRLASRSVLGSHVDNVHICLGIHRAGHIPGEIYTESVEYVFDWLRPLELDGKGSLVETIAPDGRFVGHFQLSQLTSMQGSSMLKLVTHTNQLRSVLEKVVDAQRKQRLLKAAELVEVQALVTTMRLLEVCFDRRPWIMSAA